MSKKVYFEKDARNIMLEGVNIAANAIGSTLGPHGKTVVISPGFGHAPIMTKDGVTVASSIMLEDELQNTGVMMIRGASEATVKDCGDGTTTAAVLAQSMINAGVKAVNEGANAQEVKSGIEKATICVVNALKELSIPLTDNDMIKSIGTISANNDEEIGSKLAEAYGKIGDKGLLTIEMSKTHETYVSIMEGAEMQRGFANDKFVTNTAKMLVEYDNPHILILNYDIKTVKELETVLIDFSKIHDLKVTPLVIIAKGFEGEFHNTAVVNKQQHGAKICLIEAPNMYQKEALIDMATITGATLITDDAGLKPEHARIEHLGTCKKIVVSRASTLIVEGGGDKAAVEMLKKQIEGEGNAAKDEKVKEVFEKRLARISGSIGVIYVGGATHVEQVERLHRVDDANKAIKSAIEEGVVPGGGVALIKSLNVGYIGLKGDEEIGFNIVKNACYAPLKKMLTNAGVIKAPVNDPFYLFYELITSIFKKKKRSVIELVELNENNISYYGYNVKTKEFVDMIEAKIIDPAKVVRCALQNAASVAAQVINSDVLLVEIK